MEILLAFMGMIALVCAASFIAALVRGYVLSILWLWVVTPFGLPPISIWMALGISLIVGILTHQINPENPDKDRRKKFAQLVLEPIISSLFALLLGYIVKILM